MSIKEKNQADKKGRVPCWKRLNDPVGGWKKWLSEVFPHGNDLFWNILYNLQYSSIQTLEPFLEMFSYSTEFLSADWRACGCVQYPVLLQFTITLLVHLYHRIHCSKMFLLSFALLPSLDIGWHCLPFTSSSNTKHIHYFGIFFSTPKAPI